MKLYGKIKVKRTHRTLLENVNSTSQFPFLCVCVINVLYVVQFTLLKIQKYISFFVKSIHYLKYWCCNTDLYNLFIFFVFPKVYIENSVLWMSIRFIHRISNQILILFDVYSFNKFKGNFRTEINMSYIHKNKTNIISFPQGSFPHFAPCCLLWDSL